MVVQNKMLNAVLEQGSFLAAFTGKKSFQHGLLGERVLYSYIYAKVS